MFLAVNKSPPPDDADLTAQTADLLRIVATEKRRDVFCGGQAPKQRPHVPFGRQIEPRVGSSRNRTLGWPISARAISTRRFMPVLYVPIISPKTDLEADIVQHPLDFMSSAGMRRMRAKYKR